ncbi:unnamed protein product [Ectocarpus sp. 13 AM-2016]
MHILFCSLLILLIPQKRGRWSGRETHRAVQGLLPGFGQSGARHNTDQYTRTSTDTKQTTEQLGCGNVMLTAPRVLTFSLTNSSEGDYNYFCCWLPSFMPVPRVDRSTHSSRDDAIFI